MKAKKIICHSSDGTWLDLVVEHELTNEVIKHQEKTISSEGDVAFLDKYSDGSYTFGIKQGDYKSYGHSKGYIWSSRASVINQIFGTNIMEVSVVIPNHITRVCRSFDVNDITSVLPDGWKILASQDEDGEKHHHIVYTGEKPLDFQCGKIMWSNDNKEYNEGLVPTYNLTTILQDV